MRLFGKKPASPPNETFPDWDALAERLAVELQQLAADQARFLVVSIAGTEHYLQWHGNDPGIVYAEASSGYYGGTEVSDEQQRVLRSLGWAPPGKDALGTTVRNWHRYAQLGEQPDLVQITIRTLREVHGAAITGIGMAAGG